MDWLTSNSSKILTAILACVTAIEGIDQSTITTLFGEKGHLWVALTCTILSALVSAFTHGASQNNTLPPPDSSSKSGGFILPSLLDVLLRVVLCIALALLTAAVANRYGWRPL